MLAQPGVATRREAAWTQQIGAFDDAVGEHAVQVLFDDVELAFFDAFEPVRDVEAVADFLRPRFD